MKALYLKRSLWVILLILVQVLVLRHFHFGGYATPFVYIYFLLVLNKDVNRHILMLIGFCLGLVIDIFSNTPGINAAASTLLAFLRPYLLSLFVVRNDVDNLEPNVRFMGIGRFSLYVLVAALIHHLALNLIETFSLFDWKTLLLKTVYSVLLTYVCMMIIELIRKR